MKITLNPLTKHEMIKIRTNGLVRQSTVYGGRPDSHVLWIGENTLLTKTEVQELVDHLQAWLDTGSLEIEP